MGKKSSKVFVGLDVHKESIEVALAEGESAVRHQDRIGGNRFAIADLHAWEYLVGCDVA